MVSDRASQRVLFGVSALLFAAGARGNDRLVHIHVGDRRDADARRLDDVDGVDADVRTDLARRRGVVPPKLPTPVVELLVEEPFEHLLDVLQSGGEGQISNGTHRDVGSATPHSSVGMTTIAREHTT